MTELVLLKLGGSLITDKRRPDTVRQEVLERLAREISLAVRAVAETEGAVTGQARESSGGRLLIVGHGSGSFGHAAAARAGVHEGLGPVGAGAGAGAGVGPGAGVGAASDAAAHRRARLAGVSETQERAAALHRLVLDALRGAGLTPFSVAPSSALVAAGGRPEHLAAEPVALALSAGLLPVVFGDVVMDREQGCAICSTESVFLALERALSAGGSESESPGTSSPTHLHAGPSHDRAASGWRVRHALWAGATPGVLDADGQPIESLTPSAADAARTAARGAAGTDVTGGMLHRIEAAVELARRGVDSLIFDGRVPGALATALATALREPTSDGAPGTAPDPVPGTRVLPDTPPPPA